MTRLSANLGFLFTGLPLPARIRAAAQAGFDAVEFHDQAQAGDRAAIRAALAETGLPVVALNTFMGPTMGRAALPGPAFREDFALALEAAQELGAGAVHVVAGIAQGAKARAAYLENLHWALARTDRPLLLEPICPQAAPGYHLASLEDFAGVRAALPDPRLRLMADWFHLGTLYGPALALERIRAAVPDLGHVQIARLGGRGDPTPAGLPEWRELRQLVPVVGLEYRPQGPVAPVVAALRGAG